MALLTVDELREHIETALPDTALERIRDACEAVITEWAGPLVVDDYEGTVEDVTETVSAPGRELLTLRQAPTAVASVTDSDGTTETDLEAAAYRVRGFTLRRLGGQRWGRWTEVTYTPADTSAVRRAGLVLLVQLHLNFQPGMASQGAGPWSETYGKFLRAQDEILRGIRRADPGVPRSVPYTPARP